MLRAVPPPVVLLSPQRRRPNLSGVLAQLGAEGPYAVVTAGWEEREDEVGELEAHLGQKVVTLRLHGRLDQAFEADRPLFLAYRERRTRLREQADLYRLRLAHLAATWYELARRESRPDLLEVERAAAVQALRDLDAHQTGRVANLVGEFDEAWRPAERPSLARHVAEVRRDLLSAECVLVAGGNVAVLLNRMRLFGLAPLLRQRPVFAWSAGAMALSERVVLFHDTPPQGPGHPEVLDAGLALVKGVTPLPHAATRLNLDERLRVSLFAQRFAPSALTILEDGAALAFNGRAWSTVLGRPRRLQHDGSVVDAA
jgi:hypothetical protein